MTTPIWDFVRKYSNSGNLRLHMPGHKGVASIGFEQYDIIEINGADSLYEAKGIICESEKNAGELFSADTFYSAEGSSLSIRAMLYLALAYARAEGRDPLVIAGRNVHKSFVSASALLGFDIEWIYPSDGGSYLSCAISAETLNAVLERQSSKPAAVYITSPDYLGNVSDIEALGKVCHKHGALLIVDNAHGAYLKFLPVSRHPMDLGADMCADSAHKTLPVLTGGAYLHISKKAPAMLAELARGAMALFASTSPSYLILESLDLVNRYIFDGYREKLSSFVQKLEILRGDLEAIGYRFVTDEPLKLTVCAKSYGYLGTELADMILERGITPEFCDADFLVLMLTPKIDDDDLKRVYSAFASIKRLDEIKEKPPIISKATVVMTPREAMLECSELIPLSDSLGRILAETSVGCPPAVPILVCGEQIDEQSIRCFDYYGINHLRVVKK